MTLMTMSTILLEALVSLTCVYWYLVRWGTCQHCKPLTPCTSSFPSFVLLLLWLRSLFKFTCCTDAVDQPVDSVWCAAHSDASHGILQTSNGFP